MVETVSLKPLDLNKIELFACNYLGHLLTERVALHHRRITDALADESIKRLAIEVFRGAGKTTWANVIYTLYEICEGDYNDIQSISASAGPTGLSTKVARKIRKELTENVVLIHDYQIECSKGSEYFEVTRPDKKIEVYCRGKTGSIRGSRGLVIIDDPQSWRDCQSALILETDLYWLHDDVLPVLLKDQRLVFIGTSISPLSLLATVKRKPGWTVLEFPIDNPPGSFISVWPEMFPEKFLREQYADMGAMSFDAEYRCKPLVSGNPVFREDWIEYYLKENASYRKMMYAHNYTILSVDTAMSKKKINDQTAFNVMSAMCVEKPDYFVRASKAGKYSTEEGAMVCVNMIREYKPDLVWIETACKYPDKDGWIESLERQLHTQNMAVNLMWGHPSESKLHRALSVQGMVQSGRVFFDEEDSDQSRLIADLIMFIGDDRMPDDRVDAFVHGLRQFKEWGLSSRTSNIKSGLEGAWN